MADEYPDLVELESRLRSDWSERDRVIEQMRDLRFGEHAVEVPPALEVEEVRAPIAHQIVEHMVGTLTADPLTVTVPPATEREEAQEQASKIERFTSAALIKLEVQSDTDVVDKFVETLIADGHGCLKMLYAPQLWRGFPRRDRKGNEDERTYSRRAEDWKRNRPLPIVWQWCDPLTVYPMWSDYGLEAVLETDARDPLSLHPDRWNVFKLDVQNLSRMKAAEGDTGKIRFRQLWTRDTLTYAVEDTVVHHQKHAYQAPPYAYAYGLGAASVEPQRAGLSCLWPIRHLLPYLDRLLSQKATAIRMWCWPTPVFRQTNLAQVAATGDGVPPLREIEIRPGVPVSLYQDEEITFLTWQGNGPDADEQIRLIMSMVERAGLADSMYGVSAGESGYAINQLIAAARMRFKPIVAHAERSLAAQVCTLWDIIEYQAKQTMYVYGGARGQRGWIGLSPDDLAGYRQVEIKLNPLMPTDTYARASQAINLKQAGIWSLQRAQEYTGVEQPDEEFRRILLDELKREPAVRQVIVQEAAKRLGLKLAQGNLTPEKLQSAYPNMSPAGQQVVAQTMQQTAPAGQSAEALGMQTAPAALTEDDIVLVQQIAEAMGVPVEALAQEIIAMAQERGMTVQDIIRTLASQVLGGPGVAPTAHVGGGGQLGRTPGNMGPQVMAAPGVQAAPPPPTPTHVGPVTRPSGIATGRAPGVKRTGQ